MGNIGPGELIIIMAFALIIFGPKKLPEIGRGIGNALREFNKARNDFMETINSEIDRDEPIRGTPPGTADLSSASPHDYSWSAEGSPAERKLEYPQPLDAA